MARLHLLCPLASALFTLAAQAASFTPVAPSAPPTSSAPAATSAPASAAAAPVPAAAAHGQPLRRTLWLCSLSERLTQLVCVADTDPAEQADADGDDDAHAAGGNGAAAPPPVTAQVRGTRFPLDPRQLWVVDLWTPPSAADDVAVLARATICYRSPGCEVRLSLPDLGGSAGQRVAQGARWRSR